MSPALTARRPSAERRRPGQLCCRHTTTDSSTTVSIFQTPSFTTVERRGTELMTKNDSQLSPDRPTSYICRLNRRQDKTETGLDRIGAETSDGGASMIRCRQPPCRSAGALVTVISVALRLLLLVAVLGCETHANPVEAGRGHLPRETDTAPRHQRRPPFTVDTYEEAVTYLHKYGYLQCSTARRRRRYISDGVIVREGGRNEERGRRICRESDVREAVRVLQSTLRLRPTGIIDNETRHAMSSRRCGNNDVAVSVAAAAVADRDRRGPMRPPGQRTRSRVIRNVVDDLDHRRHRPRHRRRRNNRRVDEARVGSHGVEVGSRINLTTLPPAPAIAIRGLVLEKIPSSNDEWRRRAEMLRQIKTRVTAELNRPTTARERSLARAVSRLATARRVRKRRSLRAVSIDQVFEGPAGRSTRFPKDRPVRWRLLDDRYSAKIPLAEQKSRLELSFRMWSEVTPIKFVEDRQTSILDIDILIAFGKRNHMNCNKPFDGLGGELAHSWAAGDIHFDDDEDYRSDQQLVDSGWSGVVSNATDDGGISLQKLAVHEVGHVLGLLHNDIQHSIMYPIYVSPTSPEDFELVREDRQAVQQIYGVCKGTFDATFDWLRRSTALSSSAANPSIYIFNTYFFRGSHYWMYENRFNRTRHGDPLVITVEWQGLPANIDAFTQVITTAGNDYVIATYFFRGRVYYKFDDQTNLVVDGFPRRISEDFGARPNSTDAVPDNLDAVWFDSFSSLLYFFKGEWVWVYDSMEIGRNACCVAKHRFTELFPTLGAESSSSPLTGHVDSVHYSYHSRAVFILAGETVYELVPAAGDAAAGGARSGRRWWLGVMKRGPWYNIWYDICDVE